MRSPKSLEDIGCQPQNGTEYTGRANTTKSGLACQMWSVNTPHKSKYPEVGEHNYCRNPAGFGLYCYTLDPAKRYERCDVPLCVPPPQPVEEIGCQPQNGTAYTGQANTTLTGRVCQVWTEDTPHASGYKHLGEHNYCRDPVAGIGLFCYTTDPAKQWERCDVPRCVPPPQPVEDIGCRPQNGTAYTGQANTTVTGRVCQVWTEDTPHESGYKHLGEHNYCRDPVAGIGLFCYTTDPAKQWERCDVPHCLQPSQPVEDIGCQTLVAHQDNVVVGDYTAVTGYNGKANTTVDGRFCKMWSEIRKNYGFTYLEEHNYCRDPTPDTPDGVWCFTTDPGKLWDFCDVPVCVKQSAEDIGCIPTDGTSYTGRANTTASGLACQMWSDNTPHNSSYPEVGEHNYCRNPAGFGLFCYTEDPGRRWEFCDVPLCETQQQSEEVIDCKPTDGTAYTGEVNTTASGRTCQMWSVNTPHESYHPEVGEHNYCRSPDGSSLWCYTTDPQVGWDYCYVPDCVPDCRPTDGSAYAGKVHTSRTGRTCQKWSVQTPHTHGLSDYGDHNYCREYGTKTDNIGCFTTDVRMRWDLCDVPLCKTYTKGKISTKLCRHLFNKLYCITI